MIRWLISGVGASAIGAGIVFTNRNTANAGHCYETSGCNDAFVFARRKAEVLVARKMIECGAPGLSITVHRDGRQVWSTGVGMADVENMVPMTGDCVLRVASISKPLTMAAVARAVDSRQLDMSAPVQQYLPDYPRPQWQGRAQQVSTDQLVTCRSGIRHYDTRGQYEEKRIRDKQRKQEARSRRLERIFGEGTSRAKSSAPCENEDDSADDYPPPGEFLLSEQFGSVSEALELFRSDELVSQPGSRFHYSTHGWTLVSAVLESAVGTTFERIMTRLFRDLAMTSTCLDRHANLIPRRGRYYVRDKTGSLRNAPYVDTSYKWAGGGVLSTTADLCRFADVVLYSWQCGGDSTGSIDGEDRTDGDDKRSAASRVDSNYCSINGSNSGNYSTSTSNSIVSDCNSQNSNSSTTNNGSDVCDSSTEYVSNSSVIQAAPRSYLSRDTARWMWRAEEQEPDSSGAQYRYARGWFISEPLTEFAPTPLALPPRNAPLSAQHTGGAVGCSSVLMVLPSSENGVVGQVCGVTVAIIVNLQGVGLLQLATQIAQLFSSSST